MLKEHEYDMQICMLGLCSKLCMLVIKTVHGHMRTHTFSLIHNTRTHMNAHIHMYACTHTHTHTHMHSHLYTIHTHVHTHTQAHTHTHAHTLTHTRLFTMRLLFVLTCDLSVTLLHQVSMQGMHADMIRPLQSRTECVVYILEKHQPHLESKFASQQHSFLLYMYISV